MHRIHYYEFNELRAQLRGNFEPGSKSRPGWGAEISLQLHDVLQSQTVTVHISAWLNLVQKWICKH